MNDLFEFIRGLVCPFPEIERFVPKKGKILDVGCGHGVFSSLLAKTSSERKVLGIDPSREKIKLAGSRHREKNLKFARKYLSKIEGKYDAAVLIDVLYLLPWDKKREFLKDIYRVLRKGGKLVIIINGYENNLFFKFLAFEEFIMARVLKITHSDYKGTYFESVEDCRKLLNAIGFKVKLVKDIRGKIPYPHTLFVAIK